MKPLASQKDKRSFLKTLLVDECNAATSGWGRFIQPGQEAYWIDGPLVAKVFGVFQVPLQIREDGGEGLETKNDAINVVSNLTWKAEEVELVAKAAF